MKRLTLVAVAVSALVLLSRPASAGGWAVSSLDSIPVPTAGEAVEVGFTIRQHGLTPVNVEDVALVITGAGVHSTYFAEQDGPVGHYTTSVTFASEGRFEWAIRQGWFGNQPLGEIEVGSTSSRTGVAGNGDRRWPALVRFALPVLAVGFGLVAVADLVRRRPARRWGPAVG